MKNILWKILTVISILWVVITPLGCMGAAAAEMNGHHTTYIVLFSVFMTPYILMYMIAGVSYLPI